MLGINGCREHCPKNEFHPLVLVQGDIVPKVQRTWLSPNPSIMGTIMWT